MPRAADKQKQSWKLRHLAHIQVQGLISGTVRVADIIQRIKEVGDPFQAAYLALSIASYLPDDSEVFIRHELGNVIDFPTKEERPNPTAEALTSRSANKG